MDNIIGKQNYESPELESLELSAKNSIAASGVGLFEELWQGE